ncbi:MAG: MoxR family ATPase [Planctomycetota bacterium]
MEAVIERASPNRDADLASLTRLREELNTALRGKADVIELVLACLLAKGHLLLEDLPGLGKTTLAKALAHAVGGCYSRLQCTPDLMPSDITGFNLLNQKTREFEFSQGPVFTDVLLADEINRATPRAQSALFEAMSERQVTIDRVRHTLPPTFFVIATQNPVESHGAYPLPEAQLDRFAMRLSIGYPDAENELAMLRDDATGAAAARQHTAVLEPERLAALQESALCTEISEKVQRYLVTLAKATRENERVMLGLSPRGLLTWQRVAQARAFLAGRTYVTPDDVQDVAGPVLRVRLAGDFADVDSYVDELLAATPAPLYD